MNTPQILLLASAAMASAAAMPIYNRLAGQRGIVAHMNSRTLHSRVVPRGGGVVFGTVFVLGMLVAWLVGLVSGTMALATAAGGAAAVAVGFRDDVHDTPPAIKFALFVGLAVWLLVVFWRGIYTPAFASLSPALRVIACGAVLFVPVWQINMHNFIDGVDGLAVTAGVFTSVAAMVVLTLTGGATETIFAFALLAASMVAFLYWNLPPARVFMGDAGSIFLGFVVSALMLMTIATGQLSPWTWLAILAYYIADTTTTTLCRMVLTERWYGVHRSHAYQNLARIGQSHARVTYGIVAYQVLWALPLAIWSALQPHWAIAAAALAVAPAVVWTLKYGPPLSSD